MSIINCKYCGAAFSFDEDYKKCPRAPWWKKLFRYEWHEWVSHRKVGN